MGMGGNENATFSHFLPIGSWSSETVNILFFLHSRPNLSETVRFRFNVDVRETLHAVTLRVYFVADLVSFFPFMTLVYCSMHCWVYLTFVIWWYTNVQPAVQAGIRAEGNGNNQWEWEWNGNKTRLLNLGSGMGLIIGNRREWDWKRHSRSSLVQRRISDIPFFVIHISDSLQGLNLNRFCAVLTTNVLYY